MLLYIILSSLLFASCQGEKANGFVYYPPYNNPFADQAPCAQLSSWPMPQGSSFNLGLTNNECRGTVDQIPFIAPKMDTTPEPPQAEQYTVDTSSNAWDFNLEFTCVDKQSKRQPGLYFWVYTYKDSSGWVKSFTYQTTMTWDTEGTLVFQPSTERLANMSCRYYDFAKGYSVAVRTWQLTFSEFPLQTTSQTVKQYPCASSSRPNLQSNKRLEVIVTSNRLEFPAFCPVVSCQQISNAGFFAKVTYSSSSQYCKGSNEDPADYPKCVINPLETTSMSYSCNVPNGPGSGKVDLTFTSGARFKDDSEFKMVYLREQDYDKELVCRVDPQTASGSLPVWEFLQPQSYGGAYQRISGSLLKQANDPSNGNHRLLITTVKPEHEGSYRCVVPQSSKSKAASGKPIYGYHFVKVYPVPQCIPYDGTSSQQLSVTGNQVNIDLKMLESSYILLQCPGSVIKSCPPPNERDVCEPVAVLKKDGMVCSMSNSTQYYCDGQKVTTTMTSADNLKIEIMLNGNNANAQNLDRLKGQYRIELYYPQPANIQLDVPFAISAQPQVTATVGPVVKGDGSLWWIVLIIAAVILLVLILFVIGYCLRQSGQTYPVDKKERDAGHDPVKELKDAGFTEFAAQP